MVLKELIQGIIHHKLSHEEGQIEISSICTDSRQVQRNSLFIAVQGVSGHGRFFIPDALGRGAAAIIASDQEGWSNQENKGIPAILVKNPQNYLTALLERFYENPFEKIKVIGVTGTNGKTTITYLMESIFMTGGYECGVIGTIGHRYGSNYIKADNTTPGQSQNFALLQAMVAANIPYCAAEVSSHALAQGRTEGIAFHAAVFSNLTSDHLDYHANREEYFQAKASLFTRLSPKSLAVVNRDDLYGSKLIDMTPAKVRTYGILKRSDIMASDISSSLTGSSFTLTTPTGRFPVRTCLLGMHNIYNILAAVAVCLNEGIAHSEIQKGIEDLQFVPGRCEPIITGQDFYVFADYAHTEDALRHVLRTFKKLTKARITVVFGCGGNRDASKRPKMGKVAGELANWSILTNDNPRHEDPQKIIDEIAAGFDNKNFEIIPDRKDAIKKAISLAIPGDIILVAGKGHEDYQIFRDQTIDFDERKVIKDILKSR